MSTQQSLISDLIERRFFRYLGTYIAVAFGAIQFADFIESRYGLEQNLVEKVALFLVVMLPAFVVLIYNHGRKGPDVWKPFEKVFISGSVIAASALALLTFNSETLVAATEEVEITTEDGTEEIRVIPTSAVTKKLVSFPLENATGDASNDWLTMGIPVLFNLDVEQDIRLVNTSPTGLSYYYGLYEQEFPKSISFSTELRIAQDLYADYFVGGKITAVDANGITVDIAVVDSETGRPFMEEIFVGENIYAVIDQLVEKLEDQLYVPDSDGASAFEYIDRPAKDLISPDLVVLEKYVEALVDLESEGGNQDQSLFEKVDALVVEDPDCAPCQVLRAQLHFSNGNLDAARESISKAASLAQSLSERTKLNVRFLALSIENDVAGMMRLLENWQKLYPNDRRPYSIMMKFSEATLQLDRAIEYGELAMERGHKGKLMTNLAELYIRTDQLEKAEKLLKDFTALYPKQALEVSKLADIYRAKGDLEAALTVYDDLQLMGVTKVEVSTGKSELFDRMGDFAQAEKTLLDALKQVVTVQDSMAIYLQMYQHYARLGQFNKLQGAFDQRLALFLKVAPPISAVNLFPSHIVLATVFGKEDIVADSRQKMMTYGAAFSDLIGCIADLMVHMAEEAVEPLKQMMTKCMPLLQANSAANMKPLLDGVIAKLEGRTEDAIELYTAYFEATGVDPIMQIELIEMYGDAGRFDDAKNLIDRLLLSDPHNAPVRLYAAEVERKQGNIKEAIEHLDVAKKVWSSADDSYLLVKEAKTLARKLDHAW